MWRDFPNIDAESEPAAAAAWCAGQQGRFWQYHDILYAFVWNTFYGKGINVEGGTAYDGHYLDLAQQVRGLDLDAFRSCLGSNQALDAIRHGRDQGASQGVQGTPTFLIDGQGGRRPAVRGIRPSDRSGAGLTMRAALRPIGDVARSPLWVSVAALTAVGTFLLAVWLPNLGLIAHVVAAGDRSPGDKLRFLWSSLGAIGTTFSTAQAGLTVAIAVLFGLDLALTLRTMRQRARERSAAGMSLFGITVGLLGVGCSACGAVVLSALLGAGTTAALVRALPLRGLEFGIAGVLALLTAVAVTGRQAARPDACDVTAASRPPEIEGVPAGRS